MPLDLACIGTCLLILLSLYRTAVISYPNRTIVNIAKIDALPSYRDMMSRLSIRSSEHLQYQRLEYITFLSI